MIIPITCIINKKQRVITLTDIIKHARELAREHKKTERNHTRAHKHIKIQRREIRALNEYFKVISKSDVNGAYDSVADWLLDNYDVIKDRALSINKKVKNAVKSLPILTDTEMRRFPRVFAIVADYVDLFNGSVREDELIEFLDAYQTETVLDISELWALKTVLEAAIIRDILTVSLRRGDLISQKHSIEKQAISYCNKNTNVTDHVNVKDTLALAAFADTVQEYASDPKVLKRLDGDLHDVGLEASAVLDYSRKIETGSAITFRNLVTSLISLDKIDWEHVFSKVSIVDCIFNECAAGVYGKMDTKSKNIYRKKLEQTAKRAEMSQVDTARSILHRAENEGLDVGTVLFEKRKNYAPRIFIYMLSLYGIAVVLWLLMMMLPSNGRLNIFAAVLAVIPCICISELIVNSVCCRLVSPTQLCRLDMTDGLTQDCATVMLVPALLGSVQDIKELMDRMESNYIANKSDNLSVVLLGDYAEGDSDSSIDDEKIKLVARESILSLNEKHKKQIFHYFQRKRKHVPEQGTYMGWERKRGAIIEFNRYVTGRGDDGFCYISDSAGDLIGTKYVVTLDADTVTPFESVLRLVGTMHHPLNRPIADKARHKLISGYGVLQPRMETKLVSAQKTPFARIMSGKIGTPPYTTGAFEVYQDIFDRGSFSGKGIYAPDVFLDVLDGRFAENTVLSHDMIEGCYLNSCYVSDVEFLDDIPCNYISYQKRAHRWMRGDWQLLPFLKRYVKNQNDEKIRNTAGGISKLKIIQNLRRSMLYPCIGILMLGGMFNANCLTAAVLLLVLNGVVPVLFELCTKIRQVLSGAVLVDRRIHSLDNALLNFIFAVDNMHNCLDAACRTLYRLIKHKRLLEWQTARQSEIKADRTLISYYRVMIMSVAVGAVLILSAIIRLSPLHAAVGIIFIGSPFVAYTLSKDTARKREALRDSTADIIHKAAKGAWTYFRELCTRESNYLPPDNYQVKPPKGVAPRTSPTNIGMMLAGCVAAERLGYVSCAEATKMIYNTLSSLDALEKWNGHPYNWYDIRSLRPLEPKFVSSADNGNLACALLCVREALIKYRNMTFADDLKQITDKCIKMTIKILDGIDLSLLYDDSKELLAVGYDVENGELSPYAYDMFASEARQASFYAIISGRVPVKHWQRLSREAVWQDNNFILRSWSGSMFEYLMPAVFMRTYEDTICDIAYRSIINEQMLYARRKNVPWGVSESGYIRFDGDMNYQYKAFGIPIAAKSREKGDENVISPYACALALPFNGKQAADNLIRMERSGMCGEYGFYEACELIDGKLYEVASFMAHHEGMILLSAANALCDNCINGLFHMAPEVRAGEHLLQEELPQVCPRAKREYRVPYVIEHKDSPVEELMHGVYEHPRLTGIADGDYGLVISNSGSNYSHFNSIMLNKWTTDVLTEDHGHFIFIKDMDSGDVYSATPSPLYRKCNSFKTVFTPWKASFTNTCGGIQSELNITVSGEYNATVFMLKLKNIHNRPKHLLIADYAEAALETMVESLAHPQYSDMFIHTVFDKNKNALFTDRAVRNDKSTRHYMATVVSTDIAAEIQYMTSRTAFTGRNRSLCAPELCKKDFVYGNRDTADISQCISLGCKTELLPGESVRICFTMLYSQNKENLYENVDRFVKIDNCQSVFTSVYERARISIKANNITARDYAAANRIISALYYPTLYDAEYVRPCNKNFLWKHGISGDLPIISFRTDGGRGLDTVLKLYSIISDAGVRADLVIISSDDGYHGENYDRVCHKIASSRLRSRLNKNGGIFIVREEKNRDDARTTEDFAQVKLYGTPTRIYSLLEQDNKKVKRNGVLRLMRQGTVYSARECSDDVEFFNGYGGFDNEKNEYRIFLSQNVHTPHPWSNILANERFGTLVTESGSGFVWYMNSRENKLTTWSNDPVTDRPSEVVYVKDEGNAHVMTAERIIDNGGTYDVRYGIGYAVYSHSEGDITLTKTVFVPQSDSVKISVLDIANDSDKAKTVSVYYYADCRLSSGVYKTDEGIVSFCNEKNNILFSLNNCAPENGVMFMMSDRAIRAVTNSKKEFFGRLSDISSPRTVYSDETCRMISGTDCMVIKTSLEIKAHCTKRTVLLLGAGDDASYAEKVRRKYANARSIQKIFEETRMSLFKSVRPIEIITTDKHLDALFNNFLLYQAYICRYFARTSFYQCSGAFGFRDQLQDMLAFMYCDKEQAKKHILRCASQQFEQGDVRHWWHESTGYGIRTKISDDMMFLPYACCEYVRYTGDRQIFDEQVPLAKGQEIEEGQNTHFGRTFLSDHTASLYEHCILAIKRAAKFGAHGLLLIGTGDWNDGFDKVGENGKGESVWLSFFTYYVIMMFKDVCESRKDTETVDYLDKLQILLKKGIEANAWDGEWFRRAYYDDGTPIGSAESDECKIDVIAQAWAVISGTVDKDKAITALESAEKHLVDENAGIVKLFDPPFEHSTHDPGYIKAYRSGLRENGGQYTHGAIWLVQAYMMLGESKKAYRILQMLNPVCHSLTRASADVYKVEPYVVSADVYSARDALGMGGWSWYTGSAAWMYKVILEYVLGIMIKGDTMSFSANVPDEILPLRVNYTHKINGIETLYTIDMVNGDSVRCMHDACEADHGCIKLFTDGKRHKIVLYLKNT